jgi:Putative zinc dependent peptidase (DUF5700)
VVRRLFGTFVCCIIGCATVCLAQTSRSSAVDVRLVTDEAEAVLSILAKKNANQPITETDWQRVFTSEGYVRLKAREASMKRAFEDPDFKMFVLSDELAQRAQALEETLSRWRNADITGAARMALTYLPKAARIKAKIYPVIKPRENSFVFDVENDPAIFLYIDPTVTREKFENTLAHELHHIGYSSGCPTERTSEEIGRLPTNAQTVLTWIGAFGEGFAMLAAAGGPDSHPHAVSSHEERARWDKDLANFNDDLRKIETFFLNVLGNHLSKDEIQKTAFSFYGVQGPWYTVGWEMSALIEKTHGRAKLIECICDRRRLLPTYNTAAAEFNRRSREPHVLWSTEVINGISQVNKKARKASQPSVTMPELRQELLKRVAEDQGIRNELIKKGIDHPDPATLKRMKKIDAANLSRLKAIIKQYGWPGPNLVGQDGTDAFFLLVQHAVHAYQKEILPLVQNAYRTGIISGQSYALFMDRVLVGDGKPQIYGTAAKPFDQWKGREPAFEPIEDEANVDKRRAEVGLMPLSEYREFLKRMYFPEEKRKQ